MNDYYPLYGEIKFFVLKNKKKQEIICGNRKK